MIYTYVATFIVALALGFTGGWKVEAWRWDADNLAKIQKQRENEETNRRAADSASEKHEQAKVQIKTEFKTVYKDVDHVVEKLVYRNVCFDDDGMRALSDAISAGTATGQSAPAVPGPDSAK